MQTDTYRSIEEVERDFAFLESSSSQDAVGSSPTVTQTGTATNTTATATDPSSSSPSLPLVTIVNPSTTRESHGAGWGSDNADWNSAHHHHSNSRHQSQSTGGQPQLFAAVGGSGPASFPIKQENDRSSPLLHHYYGGAQPHSMPGDDRFMQLAETSSASGMHHLLRHQLGRAAATQHVPMQAFPRRHHTSAPALHLGHSSSPQQYPSTSNSAWDLATHDGSVTAVTTYPAYPPAAGVSSSFSSYPSASSVVGSTQQLPSFSSSSLPTFSADLASVSELRRSSDAKLGSGASREAVKEEQRAASEKEGSEGGEWNDDDDDDDDDDQDEEDKEGRGEKRRKRSEDEGVAGQAGIRSRKRSSAGDVAAAKKKKVALERERRKELTNFFYRLQSCVPSLRTAPTRPTKAILLQSACDYIQTLESELTQLRSENQRLRSRESPFDEGRGPSATNNLYTRRQGPGQDATRLLFVLCSFFLLLYNPYGFPYLDLSAASTAAPGRLLGADGALGADHALHQHAQPQHQQPAGTATGAAFGPLGGLFNHLNLLFLSMSLLPSTGVIVLGWLLCLCLRLAVVCCVLLFLFLLEPFLPAWNRKIFMAILKEMNGIEGMYQMGTAEAGKQLHHFLKAFLAWGYAVSLDKAICDRVVLYTTLTTRLIGQILYRLWIGLWIPVRRVVTHHCMPITARQDDAELQPPQQQDSHTCLPTA